MSRRSPVLLTLSGGLDSTYALWRLLTEGWPVHVLHVRLDTFEGRVKVEERASANIINWLRSKNLHPEEYFTLGFDYGQARTIVRDVEIVRFTAGIALRSPHRTPIRTVVASGIAEDRPLPPHHVGRIWRLLEAAADRPIALMRPIRHVTKAELLHDIPDELRRLTWYCRRPARGPQPCGGCRTCRHVRQARLAQINPEARPVLDTRAHWRSDTPPNT